MPERVSQSTASSSAVRRVGKSWRWRFALQGSWALIPIIAITYWVTVDPPARSSPAVHSDGLGYYAWTEAILHGNFDFCQWPTLTQVHAITGRNPRRPGRCLLKYPPGLALLRFPVMAPVAAIAGPSQSKDLVISGAEENVSRVLGALALVLECWCVLAAMRRLGASPLAANLVTLTACFGTGLFHYGTFDSSFTHVYSAALFSGLILLGVAASADHRAPNPWLVFLLSLFIVLIRELDALVLLFALVAWLVWRVRPLTGPAARGTLKLTAAPVLLAILVVGVFQVLYNHWASGRWTLSSYEQGAFTPGTLHQGHVLLSYDHGLFVWYPVLALMLALALWRRPGRGWGVVAGGTIAILTAIYGAWIDWDLGDSLGMRGFVDIVPFVTVAGGLALSGLPARRLTLAVAALAATTLVTIELTSAYWNGTIPHQRNTGSQYWRVVVGEDSILNGRLG